MGHFLFIVLHLMAVLFGVAALVLTIPLHLIYAAVSSRSPAEPRPFIPGPGDIEGNITPETHVRCPDCRELVRRDARKCKHCGTALVPQ